MRIFGIAALLLALSAPAFAQDIPASGFLMQFGNYPKTEMLLSNRGVTNMAVAMFRPSSPGPGILDISPNTDGVNITNRGGAWLDISDQDLQSVYANHPISGIGIGATPYGVYLSTWEYEGGMLQPLCIGMNFSSRLCIQPDGTISAPGIQGQVVSGQPVCIDASGKLGVCAQ